MRTENGTFAVIARNAARKTDEKLAEAILRNTRLRPDDVNEILPTQADRIHCAELLAIVRAATGENERIAALKDSFDRLGRVVIRLIEHFV